MYQRIKLNGLKLNQLEENYLNKKIKKISKFFKNIKEEEKRVEIELKKDKKNFWEAEIMFKIPRHLFRANKKEKTFTEAVDKTMDALLRVIKKEKELLKENKIQKNIKRMKK